ncbi:ABC transporter ATP-binding protein, partial [bacterium]
MLLLLTMAFVFFALGRGAERTAIAESKAKYATVAWLQESMRHALLFKGPGGRELAVRRTHALTAEYLRTRREHWKILFRQIVGALAFHVVFSSALIAIGGFLVLAKQLTLGQLVSAELIVSGVLLSFSKVGKQLESLYDMLAGLDKVGHLLELPQEPHAGDGAFLERYAGPAAVSVKGVGFAHAAHGVLAEASIEVRPGERVALVGPNASGKSTLINLMYGLLTPGRGVIEIDGEPVHTAASAVLRTHVGMVRGVEIFEGTIVDNVRGGRADVSDDDVRAALEHVGLWDDVKVLPRGIETRVTTYGTNLATSQARKLVLARAVAGRPRLLLLDDALEELEPRSKEKIVDYL